MHRNPNPNVLTILSMPSCPASTRYTHSHIIALIYPLIISPCSSMCATWPVTFGSIDEFVRIWHHFPVCHMAHLSQLSFHNLTVSRGHNKLPSFPPNYFSVFYLGPNIPNPNLSTPIRAGDRVSNPRTTKLKLFMFKSLCFYSETEAGVSKKNLFCLQYSNDLCTSFYPIYTDCYPTQFER